MWDEKLFNDTLLQGSSSHVVNSEKSLAFAQAMALQHPEVDFTNYLLRFIELKAKYQERSLRAKIRNETLHFVEHIEYFAHLDDLYAKSPEVALKIVMMIVALDNYGFDSGAFIEVNNRLLNWLQDEKLPIKCRVDLATLLWIQLPMNNAHFIDSSINPFVFISV